MSNAYSYTNLEISQELEIYILTFFCYVDFFISYIKAIALCACIYVWYTFYCKKRGLDLSACVLDANYGTTFNLDAARV
jgi:hypothetical protein